MADTQLILDSHNRLCLAVSSALGSMQGPPQLLALKSEVEEMSQRLNEVCCCVLILLVGGTNIPGDQAHGLEVHEIHAMHQNCASMVEAIEMTASTQSTNHGPQCSPVAVSQQVHTGKHGRPALEVNPIALQQLLELRGVESTGKLLGCSSRTVRQRGLELGLVQPGPPVFMYETQPDGSMLRVFHRRESVHSTDEDVHVAVSTALTYPDIEREKMLAAVKGQGVSATRCQVEAALRMLRGPSESRKRKPIRRQVYTVPGLNYLWHHDGQHGLFFTCNCILP